MLFSTAHRNFRLMGSSLQDLYEGGVLQIWSGTAPTTADAVATGTCLASLTLNDAARTAEIFATAYLAFSGGAAGNTCTNITISGFEVLGATCTWATSNGQLGDDVAAQINRYTQTPIKVWAYSDGAGNVTVYMLPGHGATMNTQAVVVTVAGGTLACAINGASADQMGLGAGGSTAGVTQVAGLTWAEVASGVVAKTGIWSDTVIASGTAGYARLGGVNHPNTTSPVDAVPYQYPRIQLSVGLSGADLNFGTSLGLTIAQPITCGTFQLTEPSSG